MFTDSSAGFAKEQFSFSDGCSGGLDFDVVVVGGGMAGVMAALAAKADGNRVLIVEPSNVLGGQGTTGGVAGFCGDTRNVNTPFEKLIDRLSKYSGLIEPWNPNADRRAYDLEWCAFHLQELVVEGGIDIFLHSRVIAIDSETTSNGESASGTGGGSGSAPGRLITRLVISTAGGLVTCKPRFVIDASGSAIIPVLAGFPVENLGANKQLPMSLYFTLWDTGEKITPILPEVCPHWASDEEIPMTSLHCFPSGKVEVKMKIVGFDAADGRGRSNAEIFARRQMHGLIYYLQTVGYRGNKLDTHVLASVSRGIGVREERRIIGEHVLSEAEVRRSALFLDAVAVGTYHIDFHWPDRMERAGTGITDSLDPYHIPLRMMIPKGACNLLVPGRGASGDQMAMSSFRVMATAAQMGFAAGRTAWQCVQRGVSLREIDIPALQADIGAGGQSLDLSDYGIYLRAERVVREEVFCHPEPGSAPFAACHASTIVELRNGGFLVAWFGGSVEGNDDVSIWIADRREKAWSPPRCVARANPQPHWNPVLFVSPVDGKIHLYFKTGRKPYDWRTWECISRDEGATWSVPVPLGDEADASTGEPYGPVKNKPIVLEDGTWLAPNSVEVYNGDETFIWNARVDFSLDRGVSWEHGPLIEIDRDQISGWGVIQPTLWESSPGWVHMFLRSVCGYACYSESKDGGRTWSSVTASTLPAADSGLDLAKLDDGTLAMVCNPSVPGCHTRTPLTVFLSFDNGKSWTRRFDLETEPGEYSYPAIIPTRSGMAITYTWKRKKIVFWHGSQEQCREQVETTSPPLREMVPELQLAGEVDNP